MFFTRFLQHGGLDPLFLLWCEIILATSSFCHRKFRDIQKRHYLFVLHYTCYCSVLRIARCWIKDRVMNVGSMRIQRRCSCSFSQWIKTEAQVLFQSPVLPFFTSLLLNLDLDTFTFPLRTGFLFWQLQWHHCYSSVTILHQQAKKQTCMVVLNLFVKPIDDDIAVPSVGE